MNDQKTVLMVDDENQLCASFTKHLSKRGFNAMTASSGEEAIEIIKTQPPDVIVLDLKLPGMDGLETLSHIKRILPQARIIMFTGHGSEDTAKTALERGADDLLMKPCDLNLLTARINDLLTRKTEKKKKKPEKRAGDIMIPIKDYTTVDEDQTIKEAVDALLISFKGLRASNRIMETGHRSVLVFDKGKNLVGILGIRNLIKHIRPSYLLKPMPSMADSIKFSPIFWPGLFHDQVDQMAKRKVNEIMSPSPPSVNEDANLMELANLMHDLNVRRLVVKHEGKVTGIIREQELFFEMAESMSSSEA